MKSAYVELILNSVADGVFTVDGDMTITYFNRSAEQITGFGREEALGRHCWEVFRTNLCQGSCPLQESLATGRTITNQEIETITKDERSAVISVATSALRDASGQFIGAVETFRDLTELKALERELDGRFSVGSIVSKNPEMKRLLDTLPVIAASDASVLVEGGSGTGKGLFAKALHDLSARAQGPLVHVNCGALPEGLLETELFGHVRGAFTDAKVDRQGRFAAAEGGTLFLDEIGDASPAVQVKLLRVLQDREFEPVGSSQTIKTDARIVAATNKDMLAMVREGRFREDLYYRLGVFHLKVPELRERKEDIPLLVKQVIDRYCRRTGREVSRPTERAMRALLDYSYPGNVRELENILEHACIVTRGDRIDLDDLPRFVMTGERERRGAAGPNPAATGRPTDDQVRAALKRHGSNIPAAAEELGMHRTTLWRRARKLGGR